MQTLAIRKPSRARLRKHTVHDRTGFATFCSSRGSRGTLELAQRTPTIQTHCLTKTSLERRKQKTHLEKQCQIASVTPKHVKRTPFPPEKSRISFGQCEGFCEQEVARTIPEANLPKARTRFATFCSSRGRGETLKLANGNRTVETQHFSKTSLDTRNGKRTSRKQCQIASFTPKLVKRTPFPPQERSDSLWPMRGFP